MSNITPIHRPPSGVWPPCPPVPLSDCMSGLERCYDDVKRAQAFIKQMMIDIINCDPALIGRGTPLVGVTDGTDAQPGMVGEYVQLSADITYGTTPGTQNVSLGSLSAGDWDTWAYVRLTTDLSGVWFSLNPLPTGFVQPLEPATPQATVDNPVSITPCIRALTSQPSLIAFSVYTGTSATGGTCGLFFCARRRR